MYVCLYVETEEKREPSSDSSYEWTRGTPLLQEKCTKTKKTPAKSGGRCISFGILTAGPTDITCVCVCVCVCVAHTFSCISNTCYAHFLIHINYILVYQRGLRDGNAMPHGASELVPNGRVGETKFIRALSTSCPCIDARYETSGTMICAHNATRYIQIISYVNNKILCVDIHLQT